MSGWFSDQRMRGTAKLGMRRDQHWCFGKEAQECARKQGGLLLLLRGKKGAFRARTDDVVKVIRVAGSIDALTCLTSLGVQYGGLPEQNDRVRMES